MTIESFYSTLLFMAACLAFYVAANVHEAVAMAAREAIMAAARCFMLVAQPRRDPEALNAKPMCEPKALRGRQETGAPDGDHEFFPRQELSAWGKPHGTEK